MFLQFCSYHIFIVWLFIAYLFLLRVRGIATKSCRLHSGCILTIEKHELRFEDDEKSIIKCDYARHRRQLVAFNATNMTISSQCGHEYQSEYVYYELNVVIENSPYENSPWMRVLFDMINQTNGSRWLKVYFRKIKGGFNVQSPFELPTYMKFIIEHFTFYKSRLDLVDKIGRRVRTCEDFDRVVVDSSSSAILNSHTREKSSYQVVQIIFDNIEFGTEPVCERLFRNLIVPIIKINALVDSFYKTNLLRFEKHKSTTEEFNSKVNKLYIEAYNIDLDSSLLNPKIFGGLTKLEIFKRPKSIETRVLAPFKDLLGISFESDSFVWLIRRQGLDWLRALNSDVWIDLNNQTEKEETIGKVKVVAFSNEMQFQFDKNFEFLLDEDFCLVYDYPFRQMISVDIKIDFWKTTKSCSTLWLIKNTKQIFSWLLPPFDNPFVDKCDFEKRIQICNKTYFGY